MTKTTSLKRRKIEIFGRGLAHGFDLSFFKHYNPGKCVLRYSISKKRLFRLQKQEVQKVEEFRVLQRG